jgi:hypothetical protein
MAGAYYILFCRAGRGERTAPIPCRRIGFVLSDVEEEPMRNKVTIILAVLAAIACGCGKSSTYKTRDGELKVDQQKDQFTYEAKTKDGVVKIAGSERGVPLPDNFPKDVPIYKGAVVQLASTQDKMMMVHLTLSAPVAEALQFYQDQLKEQGWEIKSTMNMGEGSMVIAKKGERECSAVIAKEDKGTRIQLTVSQQGS